MTTVSRASGGARMSRHENDRRPPRDALPQRERGSRIVTTVGPTSKPSAYRAMTRSISVLARVRNHASRTTAVGPPIRGGATNDDQVLAVATDAFHARSPDARPGRLETQSMEVAAIADQGAVLQSAPRRELLARVGLASEVAAEPRLPLREERGDVALRVGPSPPAGGRDRHDDAALRVDDHAQRARPRRPPERVRDGPARQARDRGLLGGPGCRAGHAPRRRRRPGRCPVS